MKPPKDEFIDIDWKGSNLQVSVAVGDTIRCRFHRHGSVGEDAEFEIEDTTILVHDDTVSEYLHPEHMKKPGWTGGDAERCYWHFKAIAPGETTLIIRVLFRFDIESEHRIKVNII